MPSTDIKDYWRRSWGIGDRVGFQNNPLKNFENIYATRSGAELSNVKNEKLGFIYPHKTKEGEIKWRKTRSELKGKYDFTKEPPIEVSKTKRYKFDIDKNKWVYKTRADVIGEVDLVQKPGETFKQFHKRQQNISSAKRKKARILQAKGSLETRKTIDTWTKNWLDKNLSKYKLRDQKKFINDLKQDYKAFVKKNYSNKSKIGPVNLFSKDGLPNLSRSISEAGTSIFEYEGFKTVDRGKSGKMPTTKNPTKWLSYESFLKKIFYKNKIRTNPKLFNNIKEYFNFITTNKRAIEGRELMKNFKPDPDVLYLLDSNKSKLDNAPKGDIFSSFDEKFKTSYENYKYRMFMGEKWKANAKIIENVLGKNEIKRLTGADTIKLAMDREGTALKKIFDYTKLPQDLKLSYAVDHGQGISAAAKSGNKNLMRLAVTDLIGTTAQANTELGRTSRGNEAFESKRSRLVQAIVKGDTSKLKELNEITEKAYGKKKIYKIVDGELISSRISSAKDASGRYKQYIEKIAKIPVAKKEIIKQSKTSPILEKMVKDIAKVKSHAASKGIKLNSFAGLVDLSQSGIELPPSVAKSLDDVIKIGGKILRGVGKGAIVLDPIFAALDAAEAFGKGASGAEAAEYVVKRFGEGVLNIPGLVIGGTQWAKGKVLGEDTKFETPYEFTFARDKLKKQLDETPENVKLRRIAEIKFDQTMPYMVDVMDMPDSSEELEIKKDKFLKEELGENYKITHPKQVEEEKHPTDNLTGVDKYMLSKLDV